MKFLQGIQPQLWRSWPCLTVGKSNFFYSPQLHQPKLDHPRRSHRLKRRTPMGSKSRDVTGDQRQLVLFGGSGNESVHRADRPTGGLSPRHRLAPPALSRSMP